MEKMEDHTEMDQDSTSNVSMFVVRGTFIVGTLLVRRQHHTPQGKYTTDGTVTEG